MNIFDKIYIGILNAQANHDAKKYLSTVRAAETSNNKSKGSDKEKPIDKEAARTNKKKGKSNEPKKETNFEAKQQEPEVKTEEETVNTTVSDTTTESDIVVDSGTADYGNSAYARKYYDIGPYVKKSPVDGKTDGERYIEELCMSSQDKLKVLETNYSLYKGNIEKLIATVDESIKAVSSASDDKLKEIEMFLVNTIASVEQETAKFNQFVSCAMHDMNDSIERISAKHNFDSKSEFAEKERQSMSSAYSTCCKSLRTLKDEIEYKIDTLRKVIADRRVQITVTGFGYHKIDNADVLQKKPKPEKIKPEKVNLDIPKNMTTPPTEEKPKKVNAGILPEDLVTETEQVTKNDNVHVPTHPVFDNSHLFTDNTMYLAEICEIADKNNIGIQMIPNIGTDGRPNGLISCYCYTDMKGRNPYKRFTIDTGTIIDRRPKLFINVAEDSMFEGKQAYYITIFDEKTKKKSINTKFFDYIFQGGVLIVGDKQFDRAYGMYSTSDIDLNNYVSLITFNKRGLDRDTNKLFRERMINALNAGVFSSMKQPVRFELAEFDTKKKTFKLKSEGVPINFGLPNTSVYKYEIVFGENNQTEVKAVG